MKLAVAVGHSQRHKGATAVNGVQEWDFHRSTVARIVDAAMVQGIDVRSFIRKPSFRAMLDEINAWGPDLAIDVHFNAASQRDKGTWRFSGTCALYWKAEDEDPPERLEHVDESRRWAELVVKAVASAQGTRLWLGGALPQRYGSGGADLIFLRDLRCPRIILETHFGDHPTDHERATAARDAGAMPAALAEAISRGLSETTT